MHSQINTLHQHPVETNMDIVDRINSGLPSQDHSYFNQDIHNYLIGKGATFTDKRPGRFHYVFIVKNESVRLYFRDDLIYIQYLWIEEDGDCGISFSWLTDHKFSHPASLDNFKIILKAYLNEYSIEQ
jgi:hypothetical protein